MHSRDDMEEEANLFARHLLVPDHLLSRELAGKGIDISDDKKVKELANKFQVPMLIMCQRLVEFRSA